MLTGSFSYEGINEFLRDLSYGKGRTNPVRGAKMPKIATVEAWDGKDGELPEEEDIDLSDVDLDDHDELWTRQKQLTWTGVTYIVTSSTVWYLILELTFMKFSSILEVIQDTLLQSIIFSRHK